MNKLHLIGNLTADPESRATASGVTVCTFTVAVNRRKDKDATDFFRVNAWRQLGESCQRYLAKGRKVAVIGELQPRLYEAKNGETRLSLDVQADDVEFVGGGRTSDPNAPADWDSFGDVQASDIPF